MSTEPLVVVLEKLSKLHEHLYELAIKKTDIIKKGDMDGLQKMLKDEQNYIAAINTMEVERQKCAKQFLRTEENDITISNCIDAAAGDLKEKLTSLQSEIVEIVVKLQQQNELNQALIFQSLQFVNMTLDMIQPRPESITYGRPDKPAAQMPAISLFNSEA